MATGGTDKDFKLVVPNHVVECSEGDDVTLRCHLSPQTSAVAMEIRWFRWTDCIYLYRSGHVIEGRGYEGRVSVDPQQLQRGGLSLTLRKSRWRDNEGVYTCQVISGGHQKEERVALEILYSDTSDVVVVKREITAEERKKMEESVQSLVLPAQLEEKEKQLKEKDVEMEEKNREMEKTKQQLEEKNREMAEKNKKLEEGKNTLQEKDKQLKDKDVELEEGERLLHEKDKQIEEKEKKIKERDKRIEESEKNSQEKTKQLEMKDLQIKDREKDLKEKITLLEESKTTLMKMEKMLEDKKREMEKMFKQLEEKKKEVEKMTQQLDDKNKGIVKMNQQLDEKNKLLHQRDTELGNMTRQERERESLLENMSSELETSRIQLESVEKELQDRNSQLQDLRTQLQEQERELEERDKQLEERDKQLEERDKQLELREKQLEEREQRLEDDPDPPPIRRRWSRDKPPDMGGESPGPTPPVSPAVSELRLVLLGGSTAGKRAAGDTILGTHTLTHTSTETQHSESRQGEVAGRWVTVMETPDWFCSGLSEKDMKQDVGLCVRLSAPGPHAFLLVIAVEPSEGEERRMLEKMEDIFGEGCWGHTLILFTHTEGLKERSVEELLRTGGQELQQLVEKCGNRCHLLNVKDRPDDTKITQLLEKIEEMVSGNRGRFYSSQTYQEAERLLRKIDRTIEEKWRAMMERKEEEMKSKQVKELENSVNKIKREICEKEGKIFVLEERIAELEKELKNEKNEEKRRELERQLKEEKEKREVAEMEKERLKEESEIQKREMEERHKGEMEDMRDIYKREARAEAEGCLMKIILPELQRTISISNEKMEAEFNRQMEEKYRQTERMKLDVLQLQSRLREEMGMRRVGVRVQRALVRVVAVIRTRSSGWLLHYIMSNI